MNKALAGTIVSQAKHAVQFEQIDTMLTDIINELDKQKSVKIERRELKTLRAALASLHRRISVTQKKEAA